MRQVFHSSLCLSVLAAQTSGEIPGGVLRGSSFGGRSSSGKGRLCTRPPPGTFHEGGEGQQSLQGGRVSVHNVPRYSGASYNTTFPRSSELAIHGQNMFPDSGRVSIGPAAMEDGQQVQEQNVPLC